MRHRGLGRAASWVALGWIVVGGCGGHDEHAEVTSEVTPEPPAVAAPEAVAPTPEPEPSAEVAAEVAAEPSVPVADGPELAPGASTITTPPGFAPGGVLALSTGEIEMFHTPIAVDVIAYAPEVQEAITHQLRATMRDALDGFERDSGDPEYPNTFSADCRATLATADLVSYVCGVDLSIGRGGGDVVQAARTWEIAGEHVRDVETDDLLVEGADYEMVAEAYGADANGAIALSPNGIVFVDYSGERAEVPYAALGTLLNTSSILSRVPGALDHATVVTRLAQTAAPPETISVLADPRPLPVAAILGARAGASWLFAAQRGTLLDASTPSTIDASPTLASRLGGRATVVPWATPARLGSATLRRATPLRAAPHGPPSGRALLAGTAVVTVLGVLAAGPSRMGGGQWTFVVASENGAGWVPSGALTDALPYAAARTEAFLGALPSDAVRAAARSSARALDVGYDTVTVAETAPGTTTLGDFAVGTPETSAPRFLLTHPGTLVDVRRTTTDDHSGLDLLVVAFELAGAPTTWLWEAYVITARGEAGAPVLSVTLPLPTAPARERATVATSLTRHGTFYPFVVRGPGHAEQLYTWNGTALVAPAPAQ